MGNYKLDRVKTTSIEPFQDRIKKKTKFALLETQKISVLFVGNKRPFRLV